MSALQAGPAWVYDQQAKQYYYYDAAKHEFVYQNGTRRQAPSRVAGPAIPRVSAAAGPSLVNMPFQYAPNQTNPGYNVVTSGPSQSTVGLARSMQSMTLRSPGMAEMPGAAGSIAGATPKFDAPLDPLASPTTRPLDSAYRVRTKNFFSLGRVFLTLWTEPRGLSSGKFSKNVDVDFFPVAFNEQAFCRIRRFIIVKDHDLSCTALQISTHNGQGSTALRSQSEGVVYSGRNVPALEKNEQGLQPVAIRIDLDDNASALHHTSRVNYSKLYNIEHNIKVKPFGMVNRDHIRSLMEQFHAVFMAGSIGGNPPIKSLRESPNDMVNNKENPNSTRPANTGNRAPLPADQQDGVNRHNPNRGGGGPPGNNPPDRPGPSRVQALDPSAAAKDPRAFLRRLGFTESEIDAILNLIRGGQKQQPAIFIVARRRAMNEGFAANIAEAIANRVATLIPYSAALLQVRQSLQQARAGSVAAENDEDEDVDSDAEEDDDDEEEDNDNDDDDNGDDEETTLTVNTSQQNRPAQASQQQRQYSRQ